MVFKYQFSQKKRLSGPVHCSSGDPMSDSQPNVAQLLKALSEGDESVTAELFPIVYDELHRLAAAYMSRERQNHTLQTTALVHEAFLRLVQPGESVDREFENIDHFMATAAVVMRRILVNHAKAKQAQKRGGGRATLKIDEISQVFDERSVDLVALDEALHRLKELDTDQHRLVELRFFGGMSVKQCAQLLNISERTVYYEWAHARAWLRSQIVPE